MDGSSPSGLSLGGIPEGYSIALWVASEEKQKSDKGFNGKEPNINLGCHQVYPSSVVEAGGTTVGHLRW